MAFDSRTFQDTPSIQVFVFNTAIKHYFLVKPKHAKPQINTLTNSTVRMFLPRALSRHQSPFSWGILINDIQCFLPRQVICQISITRPYPSCLCDKQYYRAAVTICIYKYTAVKLSVTVTYVHVCVCVCVYIHIYILFGVHGMMDLEIMGTELELTDQIPDKNN